MANNVSREGVSAALQIDDKILEQLERAQKSVTAMKEAADGIAASFSKVGAGIQELAQGIKGTGASLQAAVNEDGTLKSLSLIGEASDAAGKRGAAAGSTIEKAVEKAGAKIEKTRKKIAAGEMNLSNAMGLGENSISDLKKKITAVTRASEKLSSGLGSSYSSVNLKNVTGELDRLNNKLIAAQSGLSLTARAASRAGNILKQVFSTVLVSRFVQNVVQIRGEFEMAEKSLAIILKDAIQSREIFSEIQSIAVKSPFQVKDLVKQTKQLAAYRIESDKLVETTKMLGDIASGVGVDMNRLILAYGQVKAATYLKGTELRQFSEAGVNMLGGLADRFSEIQNRAVTTGEVLQMVSKRMVSFKDVDAVLRQQTEVGGTFYKMQEQQAATIQGRISNIRDKLDIMFNEIGKSSQGMITFVLNAIDTIIQHYGILESMLTSGTVFAAVLAIFGGVRKINGALDAMQATIRMIKTQGFIEAIFSDLAVGGPIVAGITALAAILFVIIRHTNQLRIELKKMAKESEEDTKAQLLRLEQLTGVIRDTTRSTEERNKALEKLRDEFGNVLPLEHENITTIQEGGDKYKEYAAAIRESNAELLKEKEILAVREKREKKAGKEAEKVANAFGYLYTFAKNAGAEADYLLDKYNLLPEIYSDVQKRILDGTIKDVDEATREIIRMLEDAYGAEQGLTERFLSGSQSGKWAFNNAKSQVKKIFRDNGLIETINDNFAASLDFGAAGSKLADEMKQAFGALYQGDDPSLKLAADAAGRQYIEEFRAAIENSTKRDGTPLEAALTETQKTNLNRTLNSLASSLLSPLETAINRVFDTINTEFPNLPQKFGIGDMAQREGEDMEAFIKRLKEMKEEADAALNAFRNFKPGVLASPADVFGMTEQQAKDISDAISRAIPLFQQFAKSMADSAAVSAQKTATREFLTSLKSANKEMEKLDETGKKMFTQRLRILAKEAGIALPVKFEPDTASFEEFSKKYLGKLSEKERIEVQLEWNRNDLASEVSSFASQIKDLWDRYDNAKKLEAWGFTASDGQTAAQVLSELDALEQKLMASEAKDKVDLAKDIAEKRLQITRNEQEEAAKIAYEANKKALDKIGQAYQTMRENLAKIETLDQPQETIDEAKANQIKKSMQEVADAQWDAYKSTEMYAIAFGNLEGMSKGALTGIREGLVAWSKYAKDALQPTEYQAIIKQIRKVDELLMVEKTKTITGAIARAFKEVSEAGRAMDDVREAEKAFVAANRELIEAQESAAAYAAIDAAEKSEESHRNLADAEEREKKAQEELTAATENYAKAQTNVTSKLNVAKNRLSQAKELFDAYSNTLSQTINFVDDLADSFGMVLSDEASAALKGAEQGFALVGSAIAIAESAMTAYTIATKIAEGATESLLALWWPLLAVVVAVGAAVAVFKARDAAFAKQVETHKENVEKLEKAYERLEKAMDKALDLSDANQYYAEMTANIAKQRQELNEAIAANDKRKQTDEVRKETEDLQEQLLKLDDQIEETKDQWYELMGAPTDYQGLASDWASDWLSAFKETGDGLDSLKENFSELYENLVVGQLWSQVMGPKIAELKKIIDDAYLDKMLTESEAATIRAFESILATGNEEMKDVTRRLGITAGQYKGDTLQRGLETVTEQTASALESILNSTRYDVSDTNARIARLEVGIIGEGENTILSHLRSQTRYLADIARIASAVFYPGGHSHGAGALKVVADIN